jgi:hypothetical protein
LQQKLQNDHKVTISYNKVCRGKEVALAELYGKWDESFELLFRWKAEVMKRCPGSVVEIDVLKTMTSFTSIVFYVLLNHALMGSWKVVGLISSDACKGLENAVKKVFPNAEQR